MKLVVGLGNPGSKYDGTRHNVGFAVLDELAKRFAVTSRKTSFQALVCEVAVGSEKVLLLWPQTFMNLSGASVLAARDFYKLPQEDVLVLCDDFNLPLGRLRLRPSGSAGGQKGLADIVRRLGTEEVPRLRIGVGLLPAGWSAVDFVLGRFTKEQLPEAGIAIVRAADAVLEYASAGLASAMNKYNAE
ncbi:MAG: aminoacyl-tRNA hydrolase [Planctomycetota bacterium]|nr:aminoacyl-tRNA hydrolase [Planctomycetota bacterium]